MNEFDKLPIGTLIKIRFNTGKLLIVGYRPIDSTTKKEYDYLTVDYPYGFVGKEEYTLVNADYIKSVIKMGYVSPESTSFINDIVKGHKDNE